MNRMQTIVNIRPLFRVDMLDVMHVERTSYPAPWSESDMLRILRQPEVFGRVAEFAGRVVGFAVFAVYRGRIEIFNLAVDRDWRRQDIGTQIITGLADEFCQARGPMRRRKKLTATVRETDLETHQFMRTVGFKAVAVERGAFRDTDDDGYRFVYGG